MRAVVILMVVSTLTLAGVYGYRTWYAPAGQPHYTTDKATRGTIVATVTATGTVEPLLKVLVGSQVSGTVTRWYADFNQTVRVGEVLAELDQDQINATIAQRSAEVNAARALAEEAAARLTAADLDLERIEQAFLRDGASNFERDEARATRQAAEAALHAAEAQIEVAAAALRAAEIQLDKTVIRSPIDGVVISRNVDAGQTVAASLSAPTLFTIANNLRKMRVNAAVSETDIGHVRENMAAQFRVDAYPDNRFRGVVTQVRYAETVVDNVVTYQTLIEVDNADLLLRPGMTATILFEVARAEDAVLVPNAALRFDPQREPDNAVWRRPGRGRPAQPRVYKLADGALHEVPVTLGITDGALTQVLEGAVMDADVLAVGWDLRTVRRPGQGPF